MKKMMKKIVPCLLVVILMGVILCGCGGGKGVNATYTSESGEYTVTLSADYTCTWYEDGLFFDGTYTKTDDGYHLEVEGNGWYSNTVFEAVKDGDDLIITGGVVYGERFVKE